MDHDGIRAVLTGGNGGPEPVLTRRFIPGRRPAGV